MPKRVTDRQIAANRANAKKSTGPKDQAARAAVALNAIRHGLYARCVVLPDDPHADEFDALLLTLREQLKPADMLEDLVVQRIAVAHWRLRRAYRFEAEAIQRLSEWRPDPVKFITTGLVGDPPNGNLPGTPDLDHLIRYESLIERELSRAMAQLHRLLHQRQHQPPLDQAGPTTDPPSNSPPLPSAPPAYAAFPSAIPTPAVAVSQTTPPAASPDPEQKTDESNPSVPATSGLTTPVPTASCAPTAATPAAAPKPSESHSKPSRCRPGHQCRPLPGPSEARISAAPKKAQEFTPRAQLQRYNHADIQAHSRQRAPMPRVVFT